jgi:trehalose 6-phosphate phosphatase
MTPPYPLTLRTDAVSLFLDLDGTLAPFVPDPNDVGPDLARNSLLRRMMQAVQGRMAVVSGRSIADLDRILEGIVTPLAGSHGLQRRNAHFDMVAVVPHLSLEPATNEIIAFAKPFSGLRIEHKPLSTALHYRQAPELEPLIHTFTAEVAQRTGLKLQWGAMVAEFMTPGMDKGVAVKAFMTEQPFTGSIPIFVGDDLTDEDGFAAAQALGGIGVLVGPSRSTCARFRLNDVAAVHTWLERAIATHFFVLEVSVEPSHSCI